MKLSFGLSVYHVLIVALVVSMFFISACGSADNVPAEDSTTDATTDANTDTSMTQMQDVVSLRIIENLEGSGAEVEIGQQLLVEYEAWLYDSEALDFRGAMFDSTEGSGAFSFEFGAGEVIAGWEEGLVGMKEGGNRTLIIPSRLAYGSQGFGPIPPDTAVVFNITLISAQ